MIEHLKARIASEITDEEVSDKVLRFELDQAGIEQRGKKDVELVELRAEVQRLKIMLKELLKKTYV